METYFYNGLDSEGFLDDNNWGSSVGNYIDCPEYIQVTLDSSNKILDGIKIDGTHELYTSVNFVGNEYYVSQNQEWIRVITDSENRIIAGIRRNGSTYIAEFDGIDIDSIKQEIQRYIEDVSKNIKDIGDTFKYVDNPEYIQITTDEEGNILGARDNDGNIDEKVGIKSPLLNVKNINSFNIDTNNATIESVVINSGDITANRIEFTNDDEKNSFVEYLDVQPSQGMSAIVVDLPVSDGTDIESGYAYIDISDRCVKVKE